MYTVTFHADVVLNGEQAHLTKGQWRDALGVLESEPESQKPLTGPLRRCRRYRIGERRVVFIIDRQRQVVTIIAVGMRRDSEVYKTAEKRA